MLANVPWRANQSLSRGTALNVQTLRGKLVRQAKLSEIEINSFDLQISIIYARTQSFLRALVKDIFKNAN